MQLLRATRSSTSPWLRFLIVRIYAQISIALSIALGFCVAIWTRTQGVVKRHRQGPVGIILIVLLQGTGGGTSAITAAAAENVSHAIHTWTVAAKSGAVVTPNSPAALAVGPNGDLYVVDTGRDQILRQLPNGSFTVVAGTGRPGYSGDGGPAIEAEINVGGVSGGGAGGIAITKNGTVYFSDTDNLRVRAVTPNGVVTTVAGGGRATPPQSPVRGTSVRLAPEGLTIGADGDLYLATRAGVYRLRPNGMLSWVVGDNEPLPKNWRGVYANPAIENDFTNAVSLAFDRRRDLYVAGGGGFGLYERTVGGALRYVMSDRATGGFFGAVAAAPDGGILVAAGTVHVLAPNGAVRTIGAGLDTVLGRLPNPLYGGEDYYFFNTGIGLASGVDGDIYVDADQGDALPTMPAIARIDPDGHVQLIWKARERE